MEIDHVMNKAKKNVLIFVVDIDGGGGVCLYRLCS